MKYLLFTWMLLVSVCTLANEPQAKTNDFVSALSDEDIARLASRVRKPRGTEPVRVVCDAKARKNGAFVYVGCYALPPEARRFMRSVQRAAQGLRFRPASHTGDRVEVELQFSVLFVPDEEPAIRVFRNQGYEVGKFGMEYTSPQRITPIPWSCVPAKACRAGGIKLTLEVDVTAEGRSGQVRIHNPSGIRETGIRERARELEFIPGIVDGEPRAMRYIEHFWVW